MCVLVAVVMVSSCFAQPAPSVLRESNPYDQQFQNKLEQWSSADEIGKVILLDRFYGLREFVSDPQSVVTAIERIAADASQGQLVRDEANEYLAKIAVNEARIRDAQQRLDDLGFVRSWIQTGAGDCTPQKLDDISNRRNLLSTLFAEVKLNETGEVCVATAIYSPKDQSVALWYGANVSGSLSVNGSIIGSADEAPRAAMDAHAAGVELHSGWNVVAFDLEAGNSGKELLLRITNPQGGGLKLRADVSRVNGSSRKQEKIAVSDLLTSAEDRAKTETSQALRQFADLAAIRQVGGDLENYQSVAKVSPTADNWVEVSRSCGDSHCVFGSLTRALVVDPANAQALGDMAEYYSQRGQLEKARDLLRRALAADPADFVLRRRMAAIYAAGGSLEASLAELHKLETSQRKPIWLERELGIAYQDLGQTDRALTLLLKAWKQSYDDERVRSSLRHIATAAGDSSLLEQLANCETSLNPADANAILDKALLAGTPAALLAASSAAERGSDPQLEQRYSDLLAFAGESDKSRSVLARAAQSDPRLEVPELGHAADADAPYLENVAQLAKRAQQNAPSSESNVVTLADVAVERVRVNGQSTLHAQQIFYIANDRGARDYRTRSIQYSNINQQLSIVSAHLYKKDGQVIQAEDDGETSVADLSTAMYYDTRSHVLRFPTIEKGDVVELEYRVSPSSNVNPYGNYFGSLVAFQNSLPQQLHRYVLITPDSRKLNVVQERMSPAQITHAAGTTIYSWELRDIAPLASEPRGPALTEIAPYVSVSTFGNWQQLGRWYADLITPQFSLDADLRDVLARVTANAGTELEKVRAIHEFVVRNTHYVAMEFGVYSYKPYPVTQVYARRFGDCKDKASLMIALLRAAGIDAELALVRTRKLGDVSDQAINLSVFNHAVAYVPKYDLWLDGTAEYAGFHELPLDDQGAMALTVNLNGDTTLRRIPVTLPMQNYTHRVVRAEVRNNGTISFSGSAYTRGEDAPGLRREYEEAEKQRDTVRANLAQVYPSVQVDSVHVDGAHDLEHDINVNFSGSLDSFAGQKTLSLVPSWLPHKYVSSLAPLGSRKLELQLPAPWTTEEELHFQIPENASIEDMPANWQYDTPYGTATIRYERRGRELVVTTSVQFRKLRIPAAEYQGFREFCQNVEKAFHQEIRVHLAG
jgi:transglutaminase-like putative cysteine protease/tetratricopeptide (TPR) repeat protein